MSINGQDPRSNVYLLDGTLQNDFTNGPAGSAAGTALGIETIREFRVESNAYSAEFGRNSGGQINVLTKSGHQHLRRQRSSSIHRNDALDARNYFDVGEQAGLPPQPVRRHHRRPDRARPHVLLPRLRGADRAARPDHLAPSCRTTTPGSASCRPGRSAVNPAVAPYLAEFPRANGPSLGQGLAAYTFPFDQKLDEHFVQGRIDYNLGAGNQFFARYTFDDTDQFLPTDYPQFPREFISRNQFFTGEYRADPVAEHAQHRRGSASAAPASARTSRPTPRSRCRRSSPGRDIMGDIDIGGLQRFGPQSSANLRLVQNVFSVQNDLVHTRGRHVIKAGALVEHYQDNMVNPTFSLGIFTFADLQRLPAATVPTNFVGLTPEAQFDRYWRFTLFGFYAQDDFQLTPRLTLNAGLRYEFTTMPEDKYGRDSALPDLTASAPVVGPLYENPTYTNLSPRGGLAWDIFGDGRTAVRGGYGLYFNTNNHQNLIVTVTNPPFTPRPVIVNPTFPNPPFDRAGAISIRPVQCDLENPRVHVFNVNVQREIWGRTAVTVGYAGSRGQHLLRSNDVNLAQPTGTTADGTAVHRRRHAAHQHRVLDHRAEEQRRRVLVQRADLRRPPPLEPGLVGAVVLHVLEERGHHPGVDLLLRRHQRHDLGAPRVHPRLQQGAVGLRHPPQLGAELHLGAPGPRPDRRPARLLGGWHALGHLDHAQRQAADGVRARPTARARSGIRRAARASARIARATRPATAPTTPCSAAPISGSIPAAFVLQPAGTFGNTGRGDFTGPNLRTLDLALSKTGRAGPGSAAALEFRVEAFNVLEPRQLRRRPSCAPSPAARDGEPLLATFGRITTTITSARQIQLGIRALF